MGNKRTLPSGLNDAGLRIINAGSMTGTATITSKTFQCQNLDNIGIQVEWTGTPTGVISVLASIDSVNFYSLTFSPVLDQPAGSAGGYLIDLNQVPYPYIQVQYINASGSGTLNAWLSAKDLN